jgi:hypothetical protein
VYRAREFRPVLCCLTLAFAAALVAAPAYASTATQFYVNASTGADTNDCTHPTVTVTPGEGPCLTIGGALAAGKAEDPADIVSVANGTYAENVSLSNGQSLIAQGTGAVIDNPACTLPTLTIDLAASTPVQGFTIRNTCASQPAISITNSTLLTTPTATLTRDQISSSQVGIALGANAGLTMVNSTVASTTSGLAATGAGPVNATNVTVQGTPDMSLTGTTLTMDSSILAGTGITGTGTCSISFSRGSATTCGAFQTSASPGFAPGTFGLAAGSPMIDVGNPSSSNPGPDVFGKPRVQDGNADCAARIDIGAAEFQPTSGECNVPGSTSVHQRGLFEFLGVSRSVKIGSYLLCVDGPGKKICKRFKANRSSSVNWSKKFKYKGQGHYVVSWLTSNGRHQLGPTQQFDWGPCAPSNLSMKGIWRPSRLIVINKCKMVTLIVNGSFRSRNDHDFHVKVNPTGHTPSGLGTIEIIPRDQPRHLPRPPGRSFRVWGVYVCDTFHGPLGHTEIHPIFQMQEMRGNDVIRTFQSGPQYPGTPNVNLVPKGRFHCPSV